MELSKICDNFRRLMLVLLMLPLPALASGTANLFCCTDANNKQTCGDTVPQACYGREYRELGDGGRVLRVIAPPITPEQRAAEIAEAKKKQIEETARIEQSRKDAALLSTYSTEKDIELMRARALEETQKQLKAAEDKIVEVRLQRKKYEDELVAYIGKEAPVEFQLSLFNADEEIKAQLDVIARKKKEAALIRAKYDNEKRQFADLMRRGARP